jgi:hypothetical protein
MRIWLGGASNWFSFSCQICQPSLALANVIDLTTTLLWGRQMQPAQDWLPISIPQTYLITDSSSEGADEVLFIAHLLSLHFPSLSISWRHSPTSFLLSLRRARNPTNPGERQLMLDRQSSLAVDFREVVGCCNKPYRPFLPWWTGSRLFREVTVQLAEQATSQDFGSPAAFSSISSRWIIP